MSFTRIPLKSDHPRNNLGIFLLSIFLTFACSFGSDVVELTSQPNESSPAPEVNVPATETSLPDNNGSAVGACNNLYYPVGEGVTHAYQVSSSMSETISIVDTISDVTADGFTLSSQFGDVSRTQQWACGSDGLTALEYGGQESAILSAEGVSAQFTTHDVTGVTVPVSISPGDAWSQEFQIEGTQSMPGDQTAFSEGTVQYQFKAVGMETVSVPAGSFDAIKLEVNTVFDFTSTFQDVTVPVTFNSTGFSWYAPGVGWVKSVDESSAFGTTATTTIELVSYTVP